ncbi:MAG: arylesterase [Rhodospirillales bacterium]
MRRFFNVLSLLVVAFAISGAPGTAVAAERTIMALGDSLTAGYGLGPGEAFPDQLERALRDSGRDIAVTNAGVSGDTSAGGKGRFAWLIGSGELPDVVIVELGANDGLRAIDPTSTRANLADIIRQAQAAGAVVLLTGMYAPPNLGAEYTEAFNFVYPSLAEEYDVVFYPFFLEGVAGDPSLNQPDGIHPTAEGIGIIVENIWPAVIEALERVE